MVPEISVEDLKSKLDKKEHFLLLDVREQGEFDTGRIPNSQLIPLAQLPEKFSELDKNIPIAVHCRSGGRSARAAKFLLDKGFKDVVNVAGGIIAWSERIDPTIQV